MELSHNIQTIEDRESAQESREYRLADLRTAHGNAKRAQVGEQITCPVCEHQFKKRAKHHAFCLNQYKKREGHNCKDRFNNIVNPRGVYARWYAENGSGAA